MTATPSTPHPDLPERAPRIGEMVRVRTRHWLVEEVIPATSGDESPRVRLACADDDAQGQGLEVFWDHELDRAILDDEPWSDLGKRGFDAPDHFAAFLNTLRWSCTTATDPSLFQAPFRAGIKIDAYQMEPLRKALLLPRVNLFIADDTGLGKTIEAGLIVRELLLRRKVRTIVVAAPPSVLEQWKGEMEERFGLIFQILDRHYLARIRRERGFGTNPWSTHSRFLVSHRLLADPTYADPMRAWLGTKRPGSLLVLDEAHHAAPSHRGRYGIESKFTRAVRDLCDRFEHRLFLSATPHNGHSNSFSTLLELLDPHRFTRGVTVRGKKDLEAVMVRRLKEDIREEVGGFPKRRVEPVVIDGLPNDAPELVLSRLLDEYRTLRNRRFANATARGRAAAGLLVVGLQQRLLSSIEAFARSLKRHRKTVERQWAKGAGATGATKPRDPRSVRANGADDEGEGFLRTAGADDDSAEHLSPDPESEEGRDLAADAEARGSRGGTPDRGRQPRSRSRAPARRHGGGDLARGTPPAGPHAGSCRRGTHPAGRQDAPAHRLDPRQPVPGPSAVREAGCRQGTQVERSPRPDLHREPRGYEAIPEGGAGTRDRGDGPGRGAHRGHRRADGRAPPQGDPAPLQGTSDEGPPANPARHGRGSRRPELPGALHRPLPLRPSLEPRPHRAAERADRPEATASRRSAVPLLQAPAAPRGPGARGSGAEDRDDSARAGQPGKGDRRGHRGAVEGRHSPERGGRAGRGADGLGKNNLAADRERAIAEEFEAVGERRRDLRKQIDRCRTLLDKSRNWVRFRPDAFRKALSCSLGIQQAGPLRQERDESGREVWRFPELDGRVAADPSWAATLDTLRVPIKRDQKPLEWRKVAPIRPVVFSDPEELTEEVVHLHLEQRVAQRLLARFRAQGFIHHDLSRACLAHVADSVPRVVLLGRLSLYGERAERLHEEIVTVTARWRDPDLRREPLSPYALDAERRTMALLDELLEGGGASQPNETVRQRLLASAGRDIGELRPHLDPRAEELAERAALKLRERGEREARELRDTLVRQRDRVKAELERHEAETAQFALELNVDDKRQLDANKRAWRERLGQFERDLKDEPERIRNFYRVRGKPRVEPVGLVYLWPETG